MVVWHECVWSATEGTSCLSFSSEGLCGSSLSSWWVVSHQLRAKVLCGRQCWSLGYGLGAGTLRWPGWTMRGPRMWNLEVWNQNVTSNITTCTNQYLYYLCGVVLLCCLFQRLPIGNTQVVLLSSLYPPGIGTPASFWGNGEGEGGAGTRFCPVFGWLTWYMQDLGSSLGLSARLLSILINIWAKLSCSVGEMEKALTTLWNKLSPQGPGPQLRGRQPKFKPLYHRSFSLWPWLQCIIVQQCMYLLNDVGPHQGLQYPLSRSLSPQFLMSKCPCFPHTNVLTSPSSSPSWT